MWRNILVGVRVKTDCRRTQPHRVYDLLLKTPNTLYNNTEKSPETTRLIKDESRDCARLNALQKLTQSSKISVSRSPDHNIEDIVG